MNANNHALNCANCQRAKCTCVDSFRHYMLQRPKIKDS